MKRLSIIYAAAAALFFLGCQEQSSEQSAQTKSAKTAKSYDFTLTGMNQRSFSLADFRGKKLFIYFGYTQCPDICPGSLSVAGEVLDDLAPKDALVVFITLDPARDSAQIADKYIHDFYDHSIALIPTEQELKRLAKVYGVKYEYVKQDSAIDYSVAHSSSFYLIDENGDFWGEVSNIARKNVEKKFKEFLFN